MADAAKITIDQIKTLVVELQTETLASALKKFQGRRTPRTVAAARRIAAKSNRVKIPRNLLRQLFRLTGGFNPAHFKAGTEKWNINNDWETIAVKIGDLEVVACRKKSDQALSCNYGPHVWFLYRGALVGRATCDCNSPFWLDRDRATGGIRSLAEPWTQDILTREK